MDIITTRNIESKQFDKDNVSRRSVDWRDSGIVIDDDFHLSSIDFSDRDTSGTTSSIYSPHSSSQNFTNIEDDDDGDTILHLAVVGCTVDKVNDLLKICDLNAINNMMHTPLHVATMANRPEMVKILISNGAKIDVRDRQGNTPLHLACQKGFSDIVIIILDSVKSSSPDNCDNLKHHIGMTNFDGQTCLHLAGLNNRKNIIELLVNEYCYDINCQDSRSGETILHKAINQFNLDLITFILKLDQHCNQQDFSGRRPLDAINLLLDSNLHPKQIDMLNSAKTVVENRINECTTRKGCCLSLIDFLSDDNEKMDTSSNYSHGSEGYTDSDDFTE